MPKLPIGNALITALFIMTLIAIASTALIYRLNTDISRTTSLIQNDNQYLAAQLVPFWSMGELTKRDNTPKRYAGALLYTLPSTFETLYPGYHIEGKVYDLQSRFNLNNLTDGNMQQTFINLLKATDPALTSAVSKLIARATLDWISNPASPNHFTSYYRKMTPPYQSANQLMVSVSEWNQVAGVQPALYEKMSPFLTALPLVTPININTASRSVLLALNPKISPSHLEALMGVREQGGIQTQGALIQWAKTLGIEPSLLTLESRYFLSVATVKHKQKIFTLYDVIQRTRKKPSDPWEAKIISEHR